MKALTYFLDLEEPVLASQPFAGEANSGISYPYIPGSAIRGAMVRLYLNERPPTDLAGTEEDQRLFFDGSVRYLHAYPALRLEGRPGEQRMLPAPRSWAQPKDEQGLVGAPLFDLALAARREVGLTTPRGSFTKIEGDSAYLLEPLREVMVHNASTDRNVKQAGSSQVYRYEALARGQTFAGAILADDEADLERVAAWLEGVDTLYLGGSHTGGYGCVRLRHARIADWQGETRPGPQSDAVIVTLLSDMLLRGDGEPGLRLTAALGMAPDVVRQEGYRAFTASHLSGGFNRKWGLPLAQDWALAAGSVFRYPAAAVNYEQLLAAAGRGLGARRAEGYGRLAVNWQTEPELVVTQVSESGPQVPRSLSPQSKLLARRMAAAQLRALLEGQLIQAIREAERAGLRDLPSSSQLSRVRLAARHTLLGDSGNPIRGHLQSLSGARAEWEGARLGSEPLLAWIGRASDPDEEIFAELFQLGSLPSVAGESARVEPALRREFGARLVDGVMKVAIEQKKEVQR